MWLVWVYRMVEYVVIWIFLGMGMYGGFWISVVTMVDGMEDEGMDYETIGVVEGAMDIALLLFR